MGIRFHYLLLAVLLVMFIFGASLCQTTGGHKMQTARIQIKIFEDALKMFVQDTGRLPTSAEGLAALVLNPGNLKGWNGPYLANELPTDPWQRNYIYVYPGNYMEYDIYSFGPDGLEGTVDDVCNWENKFMDKLPYIPVLR